MLVSLQIIQIILSIAITILLLLQAKGAGLGGIFGGESGIYRTRRGIEKTLYQATIGLVLVFFVLALISVAITR
ncbi:MAG TPA: preprotein translocase subunit SecG [Anaerolineae bacterium]|nr:preprotein translocase subunit SecG [Anaerolineae bacterium]HMR64641.1 preprotein translocase subunit SecG [Anaerolineae bacterium]